MFDATNARDSTARLVADVHDGTVGRGFQLLLERVVNHVHVVLRSALVADELVELPRVLAARNDSRTRQSQRVWNINGECTLQDGELVPGIAQVLDPADLVLAVVHEALVEQRKMRRHLHHHIRLLLVALEAGDEVQRTRVVLVPLGSEVVLIISASRKP